MAAESSMDQAVTSGYEGFCLWLAGYLSACADTGRPLKFNLIAARLRGMAGERFRDLVPAPSVQTSVLPDTNEQAIIASQLMAAARGVLSHDCHLHFEPAGEVRQSECAQCLQAVLRWAYQEGQRASRTAPTDPYPETDPSVVSIPKASKVPAEANDLPPLRMPSELVPNLHMQPEGETDVFESSFPPSRAHGEPNPDPQDA